MGRRTEARVGLGLQLGPHSVKRRPRKQKQAWILKRLQGGGAHPLAACAVATLPTVAPLRTDTPTATAQPPTNSLLGPAHGEGAARRHCRSRSQRGDGRSELRDPLSPFRTRSWATSAVGGHGGHPKEHRRSGESFGRLHSHETAESDLRVSRGRHDLWERRMND